MSWECLVEQECRECHLCIPISSTISISCHYARNNNYDIRTEASRDLDNKHSRIFDCKEEYTDYKGDMFN